MHYGGKCTCVSQRHGGWKEKSQIWTPDQKTHFHQSNVQCSCFSAQGSLFLLVSLSSGFFAAIRPWRPDSHCLLWTVDFEISCYFNSVKHLFGLQFLRLVTLANLCSAAEVTGSTIPVAVLMRASFIIALDGLCDCTWRNLQSSWNVPYWLAFMS